MPIYEYKCNDCGIRFEVIRSIKDADDPISCKTCLSEHTIRAVSLFYAQSGSRIITGKSDSSCSGCSHGSCSTCNSN
jgi:putative FmdB family regulatory protein